MYVGLQAAQTLLDFVADGLGAQVAVHALARLIEEVVPLVGVPHQAALGGQDHLVAPALDRLADYLFGVTQAVGGSGVDEVHPQVERPPDGGDGLGVVGSSPPPATDGPRAEGDDRRLYAGSAQRPIPHTASLLTRRVLLATL